MNPSDTFDRILLSLHDAMLDDGHWPATSALIDEACGMTGNELVVSEGFGSEVKILFAGFYQRGERRQDLERAYFDNYYPWDERLPRLRQLPDGRLVHVTELYSAAELKTSRTYNEGMRRSGAQNSLNVRLDGPDGSRIVWALADPVGTDGWQSAQTRMIERLLPHIRQYVQVRRAMTAAEELGASLTGLLNTTRIGVIRLDRRGRILEVNSRARRLLRKGDGLFDQDGFLRTRLPADNARLERLLGRALPVFGGRVPGSGSMTVRRPPGLPRLAVHITPVGARQADFGGRIAVLVLVVDPASRPRVDAGLVAEALDLTPSESRVAALLAAGSSVRDIAAATGRTEGSTYWYVGQLHRKLGTSRQAELVRLVLSLAEFPGSRR